MRLAFGPPYSHMREREADGLIRLGAPRFGGQAGYRFLPPPPLRLRGTFAPDRRASESPMAIACLRLVTFLPDRPLRSVPRFRSRITFSTFLDAFLPYFRPPRFFAIISSCLLSGHVVSRRPLPLTPYALPLLEPAADSEQDEDAQRYGNETAREVPPRSAVRP